MTGADTYNRWRAALAGYSLPRAAVDLDAFDANASAVLETAPGIPVRVASKSLRCRALLQRLQEASERFHGIMCFTAPEAAWLADYGFDNLLVAYPTLDANHIARVCERVAAGKRLYLTVDSDDHVRQIAAVATQSRAVVPVSIEFDMSLHLPGLNFGVWRSPVRTIDGLQRLAERIAEQPNLRLAGIMGYEAQLAGVPDDTPGQRMQSALVRLFKRVSQRIIRRRRSWIQQAGLDVDFVNAGGTGSLDFSAATPGVTEVTAGSGYYGPHLFDHYRTFAYRPAAAFALPVVRKPRPDVVTCLGGGYLASGTAGSDRLPQPWLPAGGALSATEGAGEVQTPVFYKHSVGLAPGDPVLFRHAKAGELCERFNTLLLIRGDRVVDEVPTYRGEGQCFL